MANKNCDYFLLIWFLNISLTFNMLVGCYGLANDDRQDYIVYMGDRPKGEFSSSFHTNVLQESLGRDISDSNLLHSYTRSFNGFAAKLTKDEVDILAGMEGVVSVFPNEKKQIHTTRSWDFMGFSQDVERKRTESNVIIGMLDTGIWPESESFSDDGFGPAPKKWKGICQTSSNFTCNNKIIGARYYLSEGKLGEKDIKSPRDTEGHGTHTSSTAGGGTVKNANLFGLGSGTARGGVPSARIAVYKICWEDGCSNAAILAAFDDAIADGVDIISISVGGKDPFDYFNDPIAIGAFHAMKKGILTSTSAGNSGPYPATVANFSPWMLSVAASTIDRKFHTRVKLGNGHIYEGISINTFDLKEKMHPLIRGEDAANIKGGFSRLNASACNINSLDKEKVKGKIVVCDKWTNGTGAFNAGAVGVIMQDRGYRDVAYSSSLPISDLDSNDATSIFNYVHRVATAKATILKSTQRKDDLAPYVASFSSRGPNPITSSFISPDLAAPGVNILAAWSQAYSMTNVDGDKRIVAYNMDSGTSMACPHATATAAYIKSFHPTWSPAAIKSALMTTASPMSNEMNSDAEFAYGAGHIDPVRSINPGLVYDAGEIDFVKFLCGQGYTEERIRLITGDWNGCYQMSNITQYDLNYPAFALSSSKRKCITRVFHRTVTNVGSPVSTYKAIVKAPTGFKIKVMPNVLSFKSLGENKSFVLKVSVNLDSDISSASLVWDDEVHRVRSPIVAYRQPPIKVGAPI